jgi:hypothetical protein
MVARIQIQSVVAVALLLGSVGSQAWAENTLASYNFDYDVLESGPDTYQIFRHENAKAEITSDYASGGYASAHLTDEPNDNDFVEFQGYFPEQVSGSVRFRFKFLIANQKNLFNVALVGKERYKLTPQGINFWLIYRDGWLRHTSDSIPKKLFQPNLYEWYALDALLDMNKGTYSLRIVRESGEAAVQLENQPFSTGVGEKTSLKEYSFVGDLEDAQAADFYIDDVSVATTNATELPNMVAPGRRKYFFEIWNDYHRELQAKLQCLPAIDLEDFGIYGREYASLATNGQLEILYQLIRSEPAIGKSDAWKSSADLSAIVDWTKACSALDEKQPAKAQTYIAQALAKKPSAYIYQLSSLIIDAANTPDASSLYNRAYGLPQRGNDVRNQIALAMIAFHTRQYRNASHEQDIQAALAGLDKLTGRDLKQLQALGIHPVNNDYKDRLRRYMPDSWEQYAKWMLVLEQQYYSYLWREAYKDAYALATRVTKKLVSHSVDPGIWRERQADGAFLSNDLETALDLYNQQAHKSAASLLKMADLYHMQGDLASEKSLRESIYRNFSRR